MVTPSVKPSVERPKTLTTRIDSRSAKNIATLHPVVQEVAIRHLEACLDDGIPAKIISGTRTYQQQDELYHKRPRVTKARGGYSNHNFGLAYDIGIFRGGKYLEESPDYAEAGAIGKKLGLEWGGDWKSFVDEPHFQLRPTWAKGMTEGTMLAQLRRRVSDERDLFVV